VFHLGCWAEANNSRCGKLEYYEMLLVASNLDRSENGSSDIIRMIKSRIHYKRYVCGTYGKYDKVHKILVLKPEVTKHGYLHVVW
jgi:hypothetical protein